MFLLHVEGWIRANENEQYVLTLELVVGTLTLLLSKASIVRVR
jgi:hypothetical protein